MQHTQDDMRQMTAKGRAIEADSFSVIDREAMPHDFHPAEWEIVRRVIHATADFEYQHLMRFSEKAVERGLWALMGGAPVLADVKMILAGLNPDRLGVYGCGMHSFISDGDVIARAKQNNSTRAIEAMRKAHEKGLLDGAVVAVGNAPTALLEVMRLAREEGVRPALILGVPVGFISADESKEVVLREAPGLDIPFILSRGRKGGSTIAVSIVHALLLISTRLHELGIDLPAGKPV